MLQVVTHFKELGKSSWGMAKNFAMVGLVFAGTECVIERARAKSDIYNSLGAGCISGAALSYRSTFNVEHCSLSLRSSRNGSDVI